jgi:hypothetical protein
MHQGQNGYWLVLDVFVGAAKQRKALMPIQIQDQSFEAYSLRVLEENCPTWFLRSFESVRSDACF